MSAPVRGLPVHLVQALDDGGRGLRVLVVRMGAMGDILRTLPALRALRAGLPEARLHWVVDQSWRILLDGLPGLDGIVPVPRRVWGEQVGSPARWGRLLASVRAWAAELRALRADLALDFQANLRSGIAAWLSGAPVRLGYAGHQQKEGNRWLSTQRVPAGERRTPRVERNLELVRALGIAAAPGGPIELPLVAQGLQDARRILEASRAEPGGFAVVAPGASARQAYKKPPPELLAAACRQLARARVEPLVVWGPGEEADARGVVAAAGTSARLAPPTSLAVLAAMIAAARVFVGGDSGPMHLACALGRPVVALYGPTDPQVNRPWSGTWEAVHPPGRRYTGIKRVDRRAGGFADLSAEAVGSAVDRILARPGPAPLP